MASMPRTGERGGSRLKFLIVMALMCMSAYAGYLYIPVAYDAYLFKDLMQHKVDVAAAQGYPSSWAIDQLSKSEAEYNVPPGAVFTPSQQNNRIEVRVQFTRPIEFPGFTYNYEFDHTARSTEFLTFR